MTHVPNANTRNPTGAEFPTLTTVICHLMTCYAAQPCEPLAANIERHLRILLNSSAADRLGEWRATFEQLHTHWNNIAKRHARRQIPTAFLETAKKNAH